MYLPLFHKTETLSCLVIGGGSVALGKIEKLAESGCGISVVAPEILPEIQQLATRARIVFNKRIYQPGDCRGFDLVIAATSAREVNQKISQECRQLHIPVNVVDDPELCTVIFSAEHRDEPLIIAVSTGGEAPFLSAGLRNHLRKFTAGWGEWIKIGGRFRAAVRRDVADSSRQWELFKAFARILPRVGAKAPREADSIDAWQKWMKQQTDSDRND